MLCFAIYLIYLLFPMRLLFADFEYVFEVICGRGTDTDSYDYRNYTDTDTYYLSDFEPERYYYSCDDSYYYYNNEKRYFMYPIVYFNEEGGNSRPENQEFCLKDIKDITAVSIEGIKICEDKIEGIADSGDCSGGTVDYHVVNNDDNYDIMSKIMRKAEGASKLSGKIKVSFTDEGITKNILDDSITGKVSKSYSYSKEFVVIVPTPYEGLYVLNQDGEWEKLKSLDPDKPLYIITHGW